jgi:hypothetical protein
MAGYRQSKPDKAKAAAAALVVHLVIGAAFLTGLVTHVERKPSEVLQTIDIALPPPSSTTATSTFRRSTFRAWPSSRAT